MKLFSFLQRERTPPGTPPILLPVGGVKLIPKKWVVYENRVGIVVSLDASGFAIVHFVNEQGETVDSSRVNATTLRFAKFLEIPEARRVGLSQVAAATLGYF